MKIKADSRNSVRLKNEEKVRKKPAVIFGTNDRNGAFHAITEVIANSIDEAREGYGSIIKVTVEPGNIITIEDDGRGLPMGYNEAEEAYNWELNLCELYASGKYDTTQYENSLGTHGLGLAATQFASTFMEVYSTYDDETKCMRFEKGKPVSDLKIVKPVKSGTGTITKFQPDPEVFPELKNYWFESDMFINYLVNQAMLVDGLEIILKHPDLKDTLVLKYDNGIVDYIDSIIEGKRFLSDTASFVDSEVGNDDETPELPDYKVDMRLAFNFSPDTSFIKVFHNSAYMFELSGNKTLNTLQNGISEAINAVAINTGKISRNDKILFKDIENFLICIGTTDAPGSRTWFKNQTKGAINNSFIEKVFLQFVYNNTRNWAEKSDEATKVIDLAVANMKARIEGAEVSKKVVRKLKKEVDFRDKPKNFRDASSKNVMERELYIVEGLSALSSVKLACDPKTQGVYPVRGKVTNCIKEKITKALNNEIITDLYRVFGCGMEVKNKNIGDLPKFDINKLKWAKIIICTDADFDGYHIRCLLLTMLYTLSPSLIKSGRVYIAETPLYELTYKGETKFAFDEKEKEHWINYFVSNGAAESKIVVQRSKGLGENDAEMMHESTMNPLTRRLIQVTFNDEDEEETRNFFNALLGDDIETRRSLIDKYFDMVEVGD